MNFPLEILENIFIYTDNKTDVINFLKALHYDDESVTNYANDFEKKEFKYIDKSKRYNTISTCYGQKRGEQIKWIDGKNVEYCIYYDNDNFKSYIANIEYFNLDKDEHTSVVHEDSKGNIWLVFNIVNDNSLLTFKNGIKYSYCLGNIVIYYNSSGNIYKTYSGKNGLRNALTVALKKYV